MRQSVILDKGGYRYYINPMTPFIHFLVGVKSLINRGINKG